MQDISAAFASQPLQSPNKSTGTTTLGHPEIFPFPSHTARITATFSSLTWCFDWKRTKKYLTQETLFQSHSWKGKKKTKQKTQALQNQPISSSKEDIEKQMLNVSILTAEIARLKLSCGVVLLDLRRERSCSSRLLAISKIYAILHQWHSQNVHYAWQ